MDTLAPGKPIVANFAASEVPPPKTLITPALFSRPLPPPTPGEEGVLTG
jgi:hypothetical protein